MIKTKLLSHWNLPEAPLTEGVGEHVLFVEYAIFRIFKQKAKLSDFTSLNFP